MKSKYHIHIIRILLLLLISTTSLPAYSKISKKEMQKILDKYDVIDLVSDIDRSSPVNFWKAVQDGNKIYQEARNAAQKGKAKEAQNAIAEALMYARAYNAEPIVDDSICGFITGELMDIAGINRLFREAKLHLTYEPYENAYCNPGGDIYITAGLFFLMDGDTELLSGIFAHEISHFVLQHAFTTLYADKKRRKRDDIIKGVTAGVALGAAAYGSIKSAEAGVRANYTDLAVDLVANVSTALDNERVKYLFKYSKEQEYEADIIAYRFLEWLGIGGDKYIRSLSLVNSDMEIFHNDESDHPLTADRISLLEYISSDAYHNWKAGAEKRRVQKEDDGKYDSIYW